ncbi:MULTISPECIES: ABC transporter ATP-binding protein [unclassified Shinella]|uniref:ABC transporter ATP-binding protein n=1 Tax=unclassified Shinella TaxID=2643062 RepID=UPI00225D3E8F|nr:dipeptide/oligopeptide/nickel ABC transporter ATP-binding protein [Shinella sp. YE25]MDC7259300.1 dipeptide/oligopeptide/nickel ABC transporter ATP-binding protein [Shinella sp. YE25]CAI0336090.1 ABC-type glutathione transport system ATPase component [Rhizobiaceae bacterium]CAK7261479.1 ABC-type glutathione transport system ATPase component [Shinella sp. WSC3-e]
MSPAPMLDVKDLVIRYRAGLFAPRPKPAVNGASFRLEKGETLGIVGESGSGKTSLLRAILRLLPVESGTVRLDGQDWLALQGDALRGARQKIGVVSQNPFLSLSPRLTIAEIVAEPLLAAGARQGPALREKIAALVADCGLTADFLDRRAREISGGQAQRVAIARALALEPGLLILDEPTSALDVSVQAQILNLLADLKESRGLSMLFVTHNLKVVAHISDTLLVMRRGDVIEFGRTEAVIAAPAEAYTRDLLSFGRKAAAG